MGTYTNTLQLSDISNINTQEIYILISVDGWDFYHVRFLGAKVKKYLTRERHYSSISDGDYININFNSWSEEWLEISGIYGGNAITAAQVEMTLLVR